MKSRRGWRAKGKGRGSCRRHGSRGRSSPTGWLAGTVSRHDHLRVVSAPIQPPVDIQTSMLTGAYYNPPCHPGILYRIVVPEGDTPRAFLRAIRAQGGRSVADLSARRRGAPAAPMACLDKPRRPALLGRACFLLASAMQSGSRGRDLSAGSFGLCPRRRMDNSGQHDIMRKWSD